ncbi:hypothetical protein [Bradyrhizobium japonicum]|uniref:hypothetical protein n=1 Tax=Bradyrhizobium japonicum TaxID=375 RepID=UPI003B67134D
MTDLEDLIVKEARQQGHQPNQDAIRQAGIDLAGATMTSQGLINLPGRGVISPADFTRSLRQSMPDAFCAIDDHQDHPASDTLTERWRAEIATSRKQARITGADLARYTGVTREHIEERQRVAQEQ